MEDEEGLAWAALGIGAYYVEMKKFDTAMRNFEEGLSYFQTTSNLTMVNRTQYSIAILLHQNKKSKESKKIAK